MQQVFSPTSENNFCKSFKYKNDKKAQLRTFWGKESKTFLNNLL
jgi:hypothetical protein